MLSPTRDDLTAVVQELHSRRTPWLPAGQGSRLHWGPAVDPAVTVLSCAALNRIVEHNPGDFTVTVEAGMALEQLQQALAAQGQWLALDRPWGSSSLGQGSIGGLVARGLAGGLRQRYLGVRDQLIGISLLRADGTAARAGGKVVKNVAGYDLMRLFCGSWGSLGLITSVTLRTLPQPPERQGLVLQGSLEALTPLARWLLHSSLSPERLDWWSADLARQAGLAPQPLLLLSLASISRQTLAEQVSCISDQAGSTDLRSLVLTAAELEALERWGEGVREPQKAEAPSWLLRLASRPDQAAELLAAAALEHCPVTLAAGSGLGLAWADGQALAAPAVNQLRQHCSHLGGFLMVLHQPVPPAGSAVAAWEDAPSRALIEAVKRQFDPALQLAPNRLPGVRPQL